MRTATSEEIPPEVAVRLRGHLSAFRARLMTRPVSRGWGMVWRRHRALRVAAALACAIAILAVTGLIFESTSAPSWAQVAKRFATVPFFNATIYVKKAAFAEPVQLELWMAQGGLVRLRAGNQVVFGRNGRLVNTVSLGTPDTTPRDVQAAQDMVEDLIEKLGTAEAFSFDTLVRALPIKTMLAPPLENQEASVSNDLVVFDMVDDEGPEWVRIWALRGSRLPVRILYWDPESAASVDAVLSYFNQPPPEFFDPAAFQTALKQAGGNPAVQAYSLLKDPGGRPVTPQDAEDWEQRRSLEPAEQDPLGES